MKDIDKNNSEKWTKAYWADRRKHKKDSEYIYNAVVEANKKAGFDEYDLNRYNPITYRYYGDIREVLKDECLSLENVKVPANVLAAMEILFNDIYDDRYGCNQEERWEQAVILLKVIIDDVPITDCQRRTQIAESRTAELEAENLELKNTLARVNKLTGC